MSSLMALTLAAALAGQNDRSATSAIFLPRAPWHYAATMITLAHISDIHLAPLPPVRWRELLNKRITGYLNWRLTRGTRRSPATG